MDVPVVLGLAPGIGGLFLGAYGAVRSIRTDRRLRVLGERWRVTHFERDARLLENRMTHAAFDLRFRFPDGTVLMGVEGDLARIEPTQMVKLLVFRSMGGGDRFDVEWSDRSGGRRRCARLALPPNAP